MFLELILNLFEFVQKILSSVGPFVLLLGILIFIHELGHYLAAIYCGVRVEIFSLGFGPKILKYKRGYTTYCLSLLPLGGYVKMLGDNPLEENPSEEEKQHGFLYKKVPQKLLIAFAGPLMNLIFALFAFLFLGWAGTPSIPSMVGDVAKDSRAYKAGFRSGDMIVSANNKKISYWKDWDDLLKNNPDAEMIVKASSQGQTKTYRFTAQSQDNKNIFSTKKTVGHLEGLSFVSLGSQIGVIHNSPAHKAGLRTFDLVKKINGEDVRYWRDLKQKIRSSTKQTLLIEREGKTSTITLPRSTNSLQKLGIENLDLYIAKVGKNTPAQKAGLQKGDRLISVNDTILTSWSQVLKIISNYKDPTLSIRYRREGKIYQADLSPKTMYVEGAIKERVMVGIVSASYNVTPPEILKQEGFFGAFPFSIQQTWHWTTVIGIGLFRLIQGQVSVRTLGGPVTIGRVAHKSFTAGLASFIFIMALISLNLFILNLLPIPILDGGHILFFSIEGLMGRPLATKKLVVAQGVGFFVLISFFALTFFNDIYNWLQAW